MKRHKGRIFANIVIYLLILAFCCSCSNTSDVNLVSEPSCDVTVSQEDTRQKELSDTTKKTDTIIAKTPVNEVVPQNDTVPEEVNDSVSDESDTAGEPTEKPEAPEETDVSIEKPVDETFPEENVAIVETTENNNSEEEFTCILSVECGTILDNISRFNNDKINILPKDGVIFPETEVVFHPGESVFNVLVREMKRNKIHMEFEMTPIYETAYIRGIANIYEFDCGELSGWTYKVNGKSPNVGCSLYELKNGDKIEWIYTCG